MTDPGSRRPEAIGRAVEVFVRWARLLDSHRTFPFDDLLLTRSQVEAVFLIAHSRPPVSPGRLAEALKVTPGAVTQLVAGLVSSGLVEQRRDPADARRRTLVLSEAFRMRVDEFEQDVVRRFAPRFADLSDDELDRLAELLARTTEGP
ncbi:MAG: MarR family transcriptional regulator [Propionibacteriaceae bacterium]|nr:MarR family transcriptional regulator [Propionibacteriaceae bacterium]